MTQPSAPARHRLSQSMVLNSGTRTPCMIGIASACDGSTVGVVCVVGPSPAGDEKSKPREKEGVCGCVVAAGNKAGKRACKVNPSVVCVVPEIKGGTLSCTMVPPWSTKRTGIVLSPGSPPAPFERRSEAEVAVPLEFVVSVVCSPCDSSAVLGARLALEAAPGPRV